MEKWRNVAMRQEIYLPLLTTGNKICIFDTETTGLDPLNDSVIQFSAILYEINETGIKQLNMLDTFIYNDNVPENITKLTGITSEETRKAPELKKIFPEIKKFLESADVWMGYNIPFDISFLRGIEKKVEKSVIDKPFIDVMEMARDLCPIELKSTNLKTITEWLHGSNFKFHNSLCDVEATAYCFNELYKLYSICYNTDGEVKTLLKKAYYWKNPYKWNQQRIKLTLTDGESGDVFYDLIKHCWSCKEDEGAKRLFERLNKRDLEEQFMNKYGYRFGRKTPDEVAYSFKKFAENQ